MPRVTFPTPLGLCAIAWHEAGLTLFELPGATPHADDLGEPPPTIAGIIARVQRHLTGHAEDFSDLHYDFSTVSEHDRRVLEATLAVKPGFTATYGDIAMAIGETPTASRAVGAALGANRWPLLIPCHRIVAADGKMTGYSGPGGVVTKVRLLALEGAQLLSEGRA